MSIAFTIPEWVVYVFAILATVSVGLDITKMVIQHKIRKLQKEIAE